MKLLFTNILINCLVFKVHDHNLKLQLFKKNQMIRNLYRGGKPFLTLYIHVAIERGHDNYDFMIKEEIVHVTRQFSLKKIPRNTLNIH